jgi:hypothetical protein
VQSTQPTLRPHGQHIGTLLEPVAQEQTVQLQIMLEVLPSTMFIKWRLMQIQETFGLGTTTTGMAAGIRPRGQAPLIAALQMRRGIGFFVRLTLAQQLECLYQIGVNAHSPTPHPLAFKALCTQNLTEPTIVDGGEYFNTVLWTGDGSSPISIPGVGFQPDWVWGKKTTGASYLSHQLYDAVRGVGSGKDLVSDTTQAEGPNSPAFGSVSSLNVDGFTLTAGSSNNDQLNGSGSTYVAWNWKANGAGVTNTDGLITSTVSANPDAGFSIVTYTGTGVAATIGHGLGAKPSFFIIKKRTNSGTEYGWYCYSSVLGATNHLVLNTTAGSSSSSFLFNDIEPSSSAPYVFTVGTSPATNEISINYVAYCFAAIPGYSAFGSYTGNNAPDGTFVYTGFRPAFLLIKNTSSGTDWCIYDNKRLGYNVDNNLQRNVAAVQQTDDDIDLLSNGFKFRRASANFNGSSSTHIFMAFAENPFKYSLAR